MDYGDGECGSWNYSLLKQMTIYLVAICGTSLSYGDLSYNGH